MRIYPVFHVSLLEPHTPNSIPGRDVEPPPPVEVEENLEYTVEEILDSRLHHNQLQYLVAWKNYSPENNSWEPSENCENSQDLIQAFHRRYPMKPGPSSKSPARRNTRQSSLS